MNDIQQLLFETLCKLDDLCRKNGIRYYLAYGTLLGAVRHKGFIPWDDDVDVFMKREDYKRFLMLDSELGETGYSIDAWETDKGHHWPFAKFRNNAVSLNLRNDERFESRGKGVWVDIFPVDLCPETDTKKFKRWYRKRRSLCRYIAIKSLKWKNAWTLRQRIGKLVVALVPRKRLIQAFNSMNSKFQGTGCMWLPAEYDDPFLIYPTYIFNDPPTYLDFEGRLFSSISRYDEFLKIVYGDYMTPPPPSERHVHFAPPKA